MGKNIKESAYTVTSSQLEKNPYPILFKKASDLHGFTGLGSLWVQQNNPMFCPTGQILKTGLDNVKKSVVQRLHYNVSFTKHYKGKSSYIWVTFLYDFPL